MNMEIPRERLAELATTLRMEFINSEKRRIQKFLDENSRIFELTRTNSLVRSVVNLSLNVLPTYKDTFNQEKALDVLDYNIYSNVDKRELEGKQKGEENGGNKLGYTDYLVLELLRWFKEEFFTWINKPPCEICFNNDQNKIQLIRHVAPSNANELNGKTSVVEIYKCLKCSSEIRFPRYNNVATLLDTRKGRCGEWNNCFLIFLNALNIKSRYLWNQEDHVWCEYYSESMGRWIHIDCCENSFDNPLLYNRGWGKKMSYVIAIGDDYIIDVSDKYIQIENNKISRNKISEADLKKFINCFNFKKWLNLKDDEKFYKIFCNYNIELRQLQNKDNNSTATSSLKFLKPRESGKGLWTKQRGEDGSS
ncbi:hypothetical protein PACTADRAFT_48380 [Pachysolen tannophilus NRRL Y-2460]|uniref:Peptide:N-glycanase 1 n=1 Tax=Pachysolen tannophilus NRRL Y-2460 TaxID=669874 RepID=A0A1E4TXU0_PACTA|nr:hypothetical protein PACTADRAFT_48380 [Pachysolen tannophilus NRRL Y-2460]